MAKVAEKRAPASCLLAFALGTLSRTSLPPLLVALLPSVGACGSFSPFGCVPAEPRASPRMGWGGSLVPPLSSYVEAPDLKERLQTIDAETSQLGLRMTFETRGSLPKGGGAVVVRAYEGTDALGRTTHAVRAATPRGIVMAAGPLDGADAARETATELVRALVSNTDDGSSAFQAGTDLNGDGYPDVVLRNEAGRLEVWRLGPIGASRYEVRMEAPPSKALDADGDGQIDFAGSAAGSPGDVSAPELIAAELIDFASFNGSVYSNKARGAREAHARRAEALTLLIKSPSDPEKGGTGAPQSPQGQPRPPVSDEVRLRRALSLAWHAILAGHSRADALKALDAQTVPAPLRAEFERVRTHIERIGR